eukprot:gene18815-biopygen23447
MLSCSELVRGEESWNELRRAQFVLWSIRLSCVKLAPHGADAIRTQTNSPRIHFFAGPLGHASSGGGPTS